ncbi:MAG: hypothetical protein U0457_14630 [Candidatus Sericytochromatia bacterium]
MNDIHDISDPLEIYYNFYPIIITSLIILFIILLLIYLLFRVKRKKVINKINILSPEEKALKIIEQILKDKIIETNQTDIFYTKVTLLLKDYILEKLHLDIDPLTTKQINKIIKEKYDISKDFIHKISEYLDNLEYIKYSKPIESKSKMLNSIEKLKIILEQQII